eukprot:267459-Chlamydomonas_euryale.AAC.1
MSSWQARQIQECRERLGPLRSAALSSWPTATHHARSRLVPRHPKHGTGNRPGPNSHAPCSLPTRPSLSKTWHRQPPRPQQPRTMLASDSSLVIPNIKSAASPMETDTTGRARRSDSGVSSLSWW